MAKTTAPLLSFGAAGTIGQAVTFSKWKGVPYARQRVIPANPQSTGQTQTRNVFSAGGEVWKAAGALLRAPWERFAQGQPLTGRNKFQGDFVRLNRSETDLLSMLFSPGAKGGPPPDSVALTPGSSQISVAFTNPTPPTGWTLVSAIACAILDQDPAAMTEFNTTEGEDAATQATVVLSGLTPSVLYAVGAWLEWTKPDGSTAYSVSLLDSATPTA